MSKHARIFFMVYVLCTIAALVWHNGQSTVRTRPTFEVASGAKILTPTAFVRKA